MTRIRDNDNADVSQDRASIISIVESLAGQVDTAHKLKEELAADLDATRQKLSEESAARAELEARVRSLEAKAALADQFEARVKSLEAQTGLAERLRQDIVLAEDKRNEFGELLAGVRPWLEAATRERDSLAENVADAEARAGELDADKRALEADLAEANTAVRGLRGEVERVRERLIVAEDRSADLRARLAALKTDLAALRRDLEKARKGEEDLESVLSSDGSGAQTRAQPGLSNGGEGQAAVVPAQEQAQASKQAPAAGPAEEGDVGSEEQESPVPTAQPGGPSPSEVTTEEVGAAVFEAQVERVVLTKALSDFGSDDAVARADAARAMAGVRHELSVRALVAQMSREPSPEVRRQCVKTLSTLGMSEGLPAVQRALRDQEASVRLAAVWSLYRLAGSQGAYALTQVLSDEDEQVRRRAATCIGWLGREELARELVPLLEDSSVAVRRAAVEAMAKLGSRQVVSALIERLNDPDKSIGKAVLGVLEAITGKRMGRRLPADERLRRRLMARWRDWWKEYPE